MKLLTLIWVLIVGGCAYVALHGTVRADEPTKHITNWTMVVGCTMLKHGPSRVATIVFSDGSIVTVTGESPPETIEAVQKAVGDIRGTIYKFPCGTDT